MKRFRFPASAAVFLLFSILGCDAPDATGPTDAPAQLSSQTQNALAVLPPDVSFVAMANLGAMRENGWTDRPFTGSESSEAGARFQDFLEATGFDPDEDLHEVYAVKPTGENDTPSLVVYADLDRKEIQQYLDDQMSDKLSTSTYRGITVYQRTGDNKTASFALTGNNMMVAGDLEAVRAMIDRIEGSGRSLSDNDEAMRLIGKVQGKGTIWFTARDIGKAFGPLDAREKDNGSPLDERAGRLSRVVRDVAGQVALSESTADGTVILVPRQNADPDDLKTLLEGIVAAMKSAADSERKREMFENVEISRQDDAVHVAFALDRQTFESLRD